MNLRIVITIILIFLSYNKILSQEELEVEKLFEKIEFEIKHDRKLVDNRIHIAIYNRLEPKTSEIVVRTLDKEDVFKTWSQVIPDFRYEISKTEFKKIEKLILTIDFNHFVQFDNEIRIHGYKCALTYGDSLSSISLEAWSPTNKTEERKLEVYLAVCNLILNACKMETLQ